MMVIVITRFTRPRVMGLDDLKKKEEDTNTFYAGGEQSYHY